MYLYTVILILLGYTKKEYFSTNMQTFINGVSALSIIYLYKDRAFKLSIISLANAFTISILIGVIKLKTISMSIFELHDIAFAIGIVLFYFIAVKKYCSHKDLKYEYLFIIFFTLAFKRIGIAAIFAIIIYWRIGLRMKRRPRVCYIRFSGIIVFLVCYFWVWLIISENLWIILDKLDIDMAGRDFYYKVFVDMCELNPKFMGMGRNSVAVLLATEYEYFHVGNIHSDIFRMYLEVGYILFILWLLNYLCIMPELYKKSFGTSTMLYVSSITIYMFILYLTDNTELYLVTQYFYILSIYAYIKKIRIEIPISYITNYISSKKLE